MAYLVCYYNLPVVHTHSAGVLEFSDLLGGEFDRYFLIQGQLPAYLKITEYDFFKAGARISSQKNQS